MGNEPADRDMNADHIEQSPGPIPDARQPLYSPKQVYTGSMLGGPIAAAYFIWKNFKTLADARRMKWSLGVGLGFTLLLISTLPFLPAKTPNMVLPIAYSWVASYLVGRFQRTKVQIQDSETFRFHSNWKVVGVSLMAMVVFLIPAFGLVYYVDQRSMPPHRPIATSQVRGIVEGLERKKKEKAFVALAITPKDARLGDDDVNIEYRIVDGCPTFLWMLISKRNIADKERIKQFAMQQGVTLIEIQDSGTKILFSQDVKIKELGEKIIKEFYQLDAAAIVEMYEGQG